MKVALILSAVAVSLGGCTASMLQADGNQRADQVGETVIGQSVARAKDKVCMDNLRSVRQSIAVWMTSNETPPPRLADLRLPESLTKDPIGGEPYEYRPETGEVRCVHPGHKKY